MRAASWLILVMQMPQLSCLTYEDSGRVSQSQAPVSQLGNPDQGLKLMTLTMKGTGTLWQKPWCRSFPQDKGGVVHCWGWELLGWGALSAPAGPPARVVEAKAGEGIRSDSACICILFAFACQSSVAKDSPEMHRGQPCRHTSVYKHACLHI